jgi:phage tail sheath protein FI
MPQYLTPGVYVEEIERGPRPIEGVPTSIAAFIGETERGPIWPRLVTSYNDYKRWFGDVFGNGGYYMPYAVNGFFENGGQQLYVCRTVSSTAATASRQFGPVTLSAVGAGAWGNNVYASIEDSTTKDQNNNPVGFRLKIAYWATIPQGFTPLDPFDPNNPPQVPRPTIAEDYDDLSTDKNSPDYYEKRLGTNPSVNSALAWLDNNNALPPPRPDNGAWGPLQTGNDDGAVGIADYLGALAGQRDVEQGLAALDLDPFRDVALVHAPLPRADAQQIHLAIIAHCERKRFRFAVIDGDASQLIPGNVDPRVQLPTDTSYAAFYYPWLYVSDPKTGARTRVPPGGYTLGIYARTDTERGVFKSPANETVRGALDLVVQINDNDQGQLNPRGVNAIRRFPGRGIRVWGARTLTSNALWKYVSVRRLFIFLERSIYEGTQWVVFEPNDQRLWARVKDTIRLFLRSQWRQGSLFGATEDEAFFIVCDRTTMSQDDILNGRLICEIGIAPVRPAEFVIFRIFQQTAEAQQ